MRFSDLAEIIRRHLGKEAGDDLCSAICEEAPGEEVYIPRRFGEPDVKPTDTPATVARRHRVSRSTAYNWVNKWRG